MVKPNNRLGRMLGSFLLLTLKQTSPGNSQYVSSDYRVRYKILNKASLSHKSVESLHFDSAVRRTSTIRVLMLAPDLVILPERVKIRMKVAIAVFC